MQGYASGDIQTFYIYFSQIGHGPYKNVLVGNSDYFIRHFIVIGIYRGRYIGQKCADRFTVRNAYIILRVLSGRKSLVPTGCNTDR